MIKSELCHQTNQEKDHISLRGALDFSELTVVFFTASQLAASPLFYSHL